MAEVRYEQVTKVYGGTGHRAVNDLDLSIGDGELMVLVGPSGSGKSTALRMLAGLEGVDGGRILIDGRDVTHEAPSARDVAMVFQNYALYPHMSVEQNVAFHLRIAKVATATIKERVASTARILSLEPYLNRKPALLSGGQRQRVAMGRAIVRQPKVFLMDEPLSNLDAKLRVQMRVEVAALQRRLGTTMVYVTHDQVEAMTMGHRIAILDQGVLQQCDTPKQVFDAPKNAFVAGFIGSPPMNLMTVPVTGDGAVLPNITVGLTPTQSSRLPNGHVTVGIRPEALRLVTETDGIPAVVSFVEELGSDRYIYVNVQDEANTQLVVRDDGHPHGPAMGDRVGLHFDRNRIHIFDTDTGARIDDV